MEGNRREIGLRSELGEELAQALRGCQMSAIGFFTLLKPLLEESEPIGWLNQDTQQLSETFDLPVTKVRMYLYDLRKNRVLKLSLNGVYFCPPMIKKALLR